MRTWTIPGGDSAEDELAILNSSGAITFASGSTVNRTFNGRHPSWSPDGRQLALGANPLTSEPGSPGGVGIFSVSLGGGSVARSSQRPPPFRELRENEKVGSEGANGVAWDPRNDYIAYDVVVYDTLSMDPITFSYDTRYLIALWKLGTSEVTVLAEGTGPLGWTPNGDYLLFQRRGDGWIEHGIWQIPREGGTPLNLSALSLDGANDWLGGVCK